MNKKRKTEQIDSEDIIKIIKKLPGKKVSKSSLILSLVVLAILALAVFLNPNPENLDVDTNLLAVKVSAITDGDTVKYLSENNETIKLRFIGVNTPEKGRPYYKEATEYTRKNLLGKTIYLEFDVAPLDKYQRALAYVWLSPPADSDNPTEEEIRTKMYNARILLEGYANVMTIQPNVRYQSYFLKFEKEAREKNIGLWK